MSGVPALTPGSVSMVSASPIESILGRPFARGVQGNEDSAHVPVASVLIAWWLAFTVVRFIAGMFVGPSIFEDELVYWSMAKSFHHGMHFVTFNIPYDIPTQLYPVLLSPLFAARDSLVTYPLVKMVSALMFCSVIFPAYFMAREVLSHKEAQVVALLSVLIPGGAYTATVMAENLYYPTFVLAAWLSYRTLCYGRGRDALLAGIALCATFYAKPHVLFLITAYGLSVTCWFLSRIRKSSSVKLGIKECFPGLLYRCIPFLIFAGGLGIRFWETASMPSRSLVVILAGEGYLALVHGARHLPLRWFSLSGMWLLADMFVATAWLPLVALIESACLWKRFSEPQRWFWLLTSFALAIFLVMIARHNSLNDDALRIHERYLFQLSPLLFTWYFVGRKLLARPWLVAGGIFAVAVTAVAIPWSTGVLTWTSFCDSPTFNTLFWLQFAEKSPWAPLAFLCGGGLLCVVASLASRNPNRVLIGWAIFLIACNAGWYGFERTRVKHDFQPFHDLALNLKATLPPGSAIAFLQDKADTRAAPYANFWLSQPVYYYGVNERPYWYMQTMAQADGWRVEFHRSSSAIRDGSGYLPVTVSAAS